MAGVSRRASEDPRVRPQGDAQRFLDAVCSDLAHGTYVDPRWVSAIFKAAVGDRLIASSPCTRIALPKSNDAEVVSLTVTEVEALVAAVPDRYRALIVFAAGMGLRQGECAGLTVDRVDFLRRRVRVDRQLISARGGVPEFGPPKSTAGFRTVPMPGVVGPTLADHLARPRHFALVFTNSW